MMKEQTLLNPLLPTRLLYLGLEASILGIACFLAPATLANPIEATELFSEPTATENPHLSCQAYTPLTNAIAPNESLIENEDNQKLLIPTSSCAADLVIIETTKESTSSVPETFIAQENTSELPSDSPSSSEEIQPTEDDHQWHFKFQPYATIPVTTYGTATARGRTVNYHLGLGSLLENLRVTASGRVEAWNGSLGFIVDGYFVSLHGIGNLQKLVTRTPNTINALDYLFSRGVNTNLQELTNVLDQEVQTLKEVEQLRESQILQELEQEITKLQTIVAEDAQDLRELDQKIQDLKTAIAISKPELQALELKFEDLQALDLNPQGFPEIVSLQIEDLPSIQELEALNAKIQELGSLPNLGQLEQQLTQIRETLEQGSQEVAQLRSRQDSQKLQELDAKIQQAQDLIDKEIQAIAKIKEFQENREPQQLDIDSTTDLKFDQGIYDFAVSYHFGDAPMHELPDKPSNRNFPLVWFEPIAGIRLNTIDIEIEETLDVTLSSSLVNFQGTFQRTFNQGRTWFEPMLGGKLGVQVSDPVIFWVRGDVSGFGLAGDTDLSWNLFFGVDWWIRRNISLQLAYRFYEINYKNGSGDNAFGLEENFNGPVLSATFHF